MYLFVSFERSSCASSALGSSTTSHQSMPARRMHRCCGHECNVCQTAQAKCRSERKAALAAESLRPAKVGPEPVYEKRRGGRRPRNSEANGEKTRFEVWQRREELQVQNQAWREARIRDQGNSSCQANSHCAKRRARNEIKWALSLD